MKQIKEDIKLGKFKQIYLLHGEERYLRRQYKNLLRDALCDEQDTMNTHFYDGKNLPIGEIIDLAETLPFFADRRVIFITDSGLFKSGGEQMAEYLASPNESTFFVFTESEIDKRSKLYKIVSTKGYIAEFTKQDESTLKRWIASTLGKEGKRISENTAQLIIEKAGLELDSLQMELEKLISYCMDKDVVTSDDVEMICTTRITNHIFDMVDAIANKQSKKALALYYDLLALKEPPLRILFLIAKHCNQLLQTKELRSGGHDNRSIASKIGVPPFAVTKYMAQASKFSSAVLRVAVEKCVEAEEAIKSGRLNETMSVEILILSVFES
jgi:DNA polymerase-3 subunit delta